MSFRWQTSDYFWLLCTRKSHPLKKLIFMYALSCWNTQFHHTSSNKSDITCHYCFMMFYGCMICCISFQCAKSLQIDTSLIMKCAQSQFGNHLEHMMAVKTEALKPQHTYVPWVTLNGVSLLVCISSNSKRLVS